MKRFWILALLFGAACATDAAGFSIKDTNGKTHTLGQYQGKWVLVNFWATWCPPCLKEIPDFDSLYQTHKAKDLMVLGIAVDYQDTNEVVGYATKLKMSYPLILGDDSTTAQFGDIVGLPVSLLYDRKGRLVLKKIGVLPKKTIEEYLAGQKLTG